jgi:hypothetical protein
VCAALAKKILHERRVYKARGAEKRARNRDAHWANRKSRTAAMRARYARNAEAERARVRRYYEKNRAKVIARTNERRRLLQAVAPQVLREYQERHYSRYPHKRTARSARYRAQQARATPEWADRAAIDDIYALAELMTRLLRRRYEVHHRVPLSSKRVCGLHVPANLEVITARENKAISNKSWPGMTLS